MNSSNLKYQPRSGSRAGLDFLNRFFDRMNGINGIKFHCWCSTNILPLDENGDQVIPLTYKLYQNYPNPFNPSTVIRFALPSRGQVTLSLYNLAGQQVATLVQGIREAGTYMVTWDGRDERSQGLASGVYLYRIETEEFVKTRKMVLMR